MSRVSAYALMGALLGSCLLSGCGILSERDEAFKTLAELPTAKLPRSDVRVAVIDIDRIESSYRKALEVAESPTMRQQILLRLADLEMTRSEQQQFAATEMRRFYDRPIAMYEELIAQQNNAMPTKGIASDQLRYKLAKAYSLDGRNEEAAAVLDQLAEQNPDSKFIAETQFRRAEKAFAAGDYRNAETFYNSVVNGDNPSLQQNALYMQGWAQFKRGDYELALQSFTQVLDQLLVDARKPEQVPAVLASLGQARNNLVKDTLRVMGLSLSYLDGAASIGALQKELGPRAYQHLLYEQLGELYLEQKRFSDSAGTYKFFVENNPNSNFAPDFSIKTIIVYEQGNFPSLILPAKQEFVERYGIRSTFWTERNGALTTGARDFLHASLQELAQYEHAEAQRLKTADRNAATAAYARAAVWYREFVQTFPQDSKASAMTFLLAEALYEAGDLPQALAAYEQVAYHYRDISHGAEAGYSAILLAQELVLAAQPNIGETKQVWQLRKITNAMRFAETFPTDSRAVLVLAQAAPELLQQGLFQDAIDVSARVIAWQPAPPGALLFSTWLVTGHSRYELQEYAQAEQAYWQVLQLLPAHGQTAGAPSEQDVRERIAASIYQQAQTALAANTKAEAVTQLLRITEVTPATDVAIKARYDAGHYLLELERWSEAEAVLLSFRRQHPQHELTASIPAKLVVIYQNQSKWQQAADELVLMERLSNDPDIKRQSLIMGAELYEKSGNRAQAIEQYRRYANEYPQPLAENLEAQYRLTELYRESNNANQRQFWLQKLIETDRNAGNARSDRSRYLAASAASELAQPTYDEFARITLQLPLKASLQRKRAALEKALKAQEQVLEYGVAEYATRASFTIGEIYAQLSRDLMSSQRPNNLDELELEQYDMLLEEQAYPFEEKAIDIHQANARRSRSGTYDEWVQRSFDALAKLLPARFNKRESELEVSREIY
jgi:tetratricopeptide (TPR) repeat protein